MFRSLVCRLPRQASAVAPSRLVSLPRTYSTVRDDNTRSDNGGIDSRHFDRVYRGDFPTDYPGEILPLDTSRLNSQVLDNLRPSGLDAKGRRYTTFNAEGTQLQVRTARSAVHNALALSLKLSVSSHVPEKGAIVQGNLPLPAATHQVRPIRNVNKPTLVLAVTLSQPRKLLDDVLPDFFRSTPSVQKVIVVNVHESPEFVNPLPSDVNKFHDLQKIPHHARSYTKALVYHPNSQPKLEVQDAFEGEPCGPISLHGQKWAGEFSADVQIWARNPVTDEGKPEGNPVVFFGPGKNTLPDIQLALSDFGSKQPDMGVHINWANWIKELERGVKKLAIERYDAAARKLARRLRQKGFGKGRKPASQQDAEEVSKETATAEK